MSALKKSRGRPPTDTEAVNLRLPRDMIKRLDDLRRVEPDLPTRPEMIRRILQAWIEQNAAGNVEGR